MFDEIETVYLEPKTAFDFGIIKDNPSKMGVISFQPISIQEKEGTITIVGKVDDNETTLKYEKETLTPRYKVLVAWVYLLLRKYETQDKTNKIASEYLKEALKEDLEMLRQKPIDERWAFPYYLISNYGLDVAKVLNVRAEMYKFLKCSKPLFLDFYKEILRQEKNPIRKVAVARIAEKIYPSEGWFIREIADDLFDQHKYDECIAYLLSVEKRIHDKKEWDETAGRMTLWQCYLKKRMYKEALAELSTPLHDPYFYEDYASLLRGIVFIYQRKWADAIKNFEQVVIEDVKDTNLAICASYYLIECFLATKNLVKVEQVISAFKLQEDELFLFDTRVHFGNDAVRILSKVIKSRAISDEGVAKLKGMLAYILYKLLPAKNENKRRKLTSREKDGIEKALKLTKQALDFFPAEVFFNALYSELLYEKKLYEEAMDYKIKSLIKDAGLGVIYANVELADCTDEYLHSYPQKVRDTFSMFDATPENYIEYYGFDNDVTALWKRKLYRQIADLYLYVKPYIKDYKNIGEISSHTGGTGLFEIAYSLSEAGNKEEAKWVYEKHNNLNGENSSSLNNLAIIFEKEGNLKKAKELITKAKSLNSDDEIVNRNCGRICGNKNDGNAQKERKEIAAQKRKKDKLTFDPITGEISLGSNKCSIPFASNQYQLCKILFAKPLGQWLNETDFMNDFFKGKESARSFYDAIRLTNQKIEQGLKIKKLLIYNASRVQIRTEGLG